MKQHGDYILSAHEILCQTNRIIYNFHFGNDNTIEALKIETLKIETSTHSLFVFVYMNKVVHVMMMSALAWEARKHRIRTHKCRISNPDLKLSTVVSW